MALDAADWDPVLHEQHSELACSVTSVSGMVETVSPWLTVAPWAHPLTVPLLRAGRHEPVDPAVRVHEHDCSARVFFLTYPSLFLRPV